MTTQTFYHIALVAHIIGLTMMAGTTLVDYVLTRQFWKQYALEKPKGISIYESMSKFPILFGIGMLLLIVSGVTMMGITKGIFGEQIWFRIKFGLVLLIIFNGLFIGRTLARRLRKNLAAESAGSNIQEGLAKIKGNLNLFHLSQMVLFMTIFTLSVFKFN